jgi:hypothetical protein
MPSLANALPPSSPTRATRPWRWASLLLALAAAPVTLAQPPSPAPAAALDFAKEAARAEASSEVVRVAPEYQANLTVRGAERVRVDDREVARASLGEPDQVMVRGVRQGRTELLVWRKGERPLRVRVEVAP